LPNTLEFPHANEVDLSAQFGWYYVVGTALGSNGRHYGILLMMLSTALLPPPIAASLSLTPTENMTTQLQLAVNEEGGAHYQVRPTIVGGTTGLLEFKPDLFYSVMGKNRMESVHKDGRFFPMQMRAKGWDYSTAPPTPIKINITFSSGSNYLREGNNGCEPCCGRIGTLYYSIPRMVLDGARSTLDLNGRKIRLKSGVFWLDHQWGTSGNPKVDVLRAAGNTQPPGVGGWDFFPVDFTGDRELVVLALHSAAFKNYYGQTGPNPPGPEPMTVTVHGKYVDENDHFTQVKGTLSVTKWVRSTSTPDPAQFPVSHVWYPDQWEFSFGKTLPPDISKFTMKPLTNGDSTLYFANGTQYQEAPVQIINSQGDKVGTGYAEGTDYSLVPVVTSNQLQIAGLPDTPAAFTPPAPSPALINESKIFIEKPENKIKLAIEGLLCSINTDGTPADDELQFEGRFP
jgi:CrtC N-terminal lipocalin domain